MRASFLSNELLAQIGHQRQTQILIQQAGFSEANKSYRRLDTDQMFQRKWECTEK